MSKTYPPAAVTEEDFNAATEAMKPLLQLVSDYEQGDEESTKPTIGAYHEACERLIALQEVLDRFALENDPLQDMSDEETDYHDF